MLRLVFIVVAGIVSAPASETESPITALAFAPGGESLVAVSQSGLHVFSWPELKLTRTIKVSSPNLHAVAFSADGKHLAVGGGRPSEEGVVSIFSWPTGKFVASLDGHGDSVRSLAWLDKSRLISASIDRRIKLWDIKTAKAVSTLKGHSRSVDTICLLKDGKTLVSAGVDQSVRVWDVESGRLVRSSNQHTQPVQAMALRPVADGLPMVASAASDRTIRFWQPTIGRMVRYVRLDAEPLNIAWLPDGSRMVASCVDGRVHVVDADEVKVTQTLPAIKGYAYAIAVHPSDSGIVVGGSDGQLRRIVVGATEENRPPATR